MKKIKKEHQEVLSSIKRISVSILENMYALANYEITNNTSLYNKTLYSLVSTLSLERNLYNKLNYKDKDELEAIINKIDDVSYAYNIVNDLNVAIMGSNEDLMLRRINNTIVNKTTYFSSNEIEDLENVNEIDKINKSVRLDYIRTVNYYLDKCVNDEEYSSVRNDLITLKYKLALIDNTVLDELIRNSFKVNDTLYWNSNLLCDYYGVDNSAIEYYNIEMTSDIFRTYLNDALIVSEDEYNESFKDLYTSNILLFLKSGMLFVDINYVNELKKYLNTLLDSKENMKIKPNRVVIKELLSILDNYSKEIETPHSLSLPH